MAVFVVFCDYSCLEVNLTVTKDYHIYMLQSSERRGWGSKIGKLGRCKLFFKNSNTIRYIYFLKEFWYCRLRYTGYRLTWVNSKWLTDMSKQIWHFIQLLLKRTFINNVRRKGLGGEECGTIIGGEACGTNKRLQGSMSLNFKTRMQGYSNTMWHFFCTDDVTFYS